MDAKWFSSFAMTHLMDLYQRYGFNLSLQQCLEFRSFDHFENGKQIGYQQAPKTFEIELILKELLSDARFSSDYLGAKL